MSMKIHWFSPHVFQSFLRNMSLKPGSFLTILEFSRGFLTFLCQFGFSREGRDPKVAVVR